MGFTTRPVATTRLDAVALGADDWDVALVDDLVIMAAGAHHVKKPPNCKTRLAFLHCS